MYGETCFPHASTLPVLSRTKPELVRCMLAWLTCPCHYIMCRVRSVPD